MLLFALTSTTCKLRGSVNDAKLAYMAVGFHSVSHVKIMKSLVKEVNVHRVKCT